MYKFVAIVQVENKNGVKGCVIYRGITEDWTCHSEIEKLIGKDLKKHEIVICNKGTINYKEARGKTNGIKLLYKKAYRGKKMKA